MATSENSPERKPLTNAELCAAFDCTPPYLTKLRDQKAMPAFYDVAEAIAWRAIHAPPRGRRSIGKNRDEVPPQLPPDPNAPPGSTNTTAGTNPSLPPNNGTGRGRRGKIINIKKFISKTDDFDALMLSQAEAVPQIAYGLLQLAASEGDTVEVSSQLKNWGDAGKVAGAVREKFLETQEKARTLLPLDEVEDVIGTGLQEIRNGLLKHDDRIAATLLSHFTAEQLALIRKTVADDIDFIFQKISAVPDRTRRELVAS